jgi:putative transposase
VKKVSHPRIVRKPFAHQLRLPEQVTLSLVELTRSAKEGLLAFCVATGLRVLQQMMDGEVIERVGERGKHNPLRTAVRHGYEARTLPLGGRRVEVRRPRMRTIDDEEVGLSSYEFFAREDLLTEVALERMLAGLSTRQYRAGLEPVGTLPSRATQRSSISRRFIEGTQRQLDELRQRDLSKLELVVIFVDGIVLDEHCCVLALGVDSTGKKHPLGLWEGSTENATVCTALLTSLIERGLDPERARLFVIDGGKAIRKAILSCFGQQAVIQRCQAHKERNVTDHLPEAERGFVANKLERAWRHPDATQAEAELRALAKALRAKHPGAASSLEEGLEETLTVTKLGLPSTLFTTFHTTNPAESMLSVNHTVKRNVKRWRNGTMVLRWTAAGILEAEKRFRRIRGYRELPLLINALREHEEVIKPKPMTNRRRAVA